MQYLPAVEIETAANPDISVIWLHGLGADGNDFAPIIPDLKIPAALPIRFIFPHAPAIPVTVNGGFVMPAWYDILEMEIDRKIDSAGLLESADEINKLIDREYERGIKSNRIIIAGFSQGGAVAYQVALTHPKPLAGLLTMSSYFATAETIIYNSANKDIPIEIHHGQFDPVVPEALGQKASLQLSEKGYKVGYTVYPMEHAVCLEQINDISNWLQTVLKQD